MMKKHFILIIFLILVVYKIQARETIYLARSPKALLMGDAYTAIADDEYTLFYNPASLGKNGTVSIAVNPINPTFGITNALTELDRFSDFPAEPDLVAERIMGFPIYLNVGALPMMKFGPFAIGFFYNIHTSLLMQNATHPVLGINYFQDRGFIMGYSHSFGNGGRRNKDGSRTIGNRTSVGFSVKKMNRQSLSDDYPVFGSELFKTIIAGASDPTQIRETLGYSAGESWGWDLGAEYVLSTQRSQLSAGISILDVGDTQFKVTSGSEVPSQEMIISSGVAWKQDFTLIDYTIALDFHPLLRPMDFMRRLHLGFDIGLPGFRFLAGYNGGYLSYGAMFRIWPVKITVGLYGVEVGSHFRQKEASRAMIYLSLLDFTFEG